jgi:Transcriptional regulator
LTKTARHYILKKGRWSFLQVLKDEIKNKILQVATQEFLAKGFCSASTREIVKKVHVSKGNLYHYFPSKEDLFNTIVTPFYRELSCFLQQLWAHETGESFTPEKVEFMTKRIAEFIRDHRNEFILIMDKSEGTQYAGFKKEITAAIQSHFEKNVKPGYKNKPDSRISIMHIIAGNFIETLLAIAKDSQDDGEAVCILELYLKYHMRGVSQFY